MQDKTILLVNLLHSDGQDHMAYLIDLALADRASDVAKDAWEGYSESDMTGDWEEFLETRLKDAGIAFTAIGTESVDIDTED